MGLVDAVVSPNELVATARRWALDILERRRPWVASLHRTDKLEPLGEAREIFKFARVQTKKQAPNLTHPLVCVDVVEEGVVSGPLAGLWKVAPSSINYVYIRRCGSVKLCIRCCRKLKLFKGFYILRRARAWCIFSLLNVELQRFEWSLHSSI